MRARLCATALAVTLLLTAGGCGLLPDRGPAGKTVITLKATTRDGGTPSAGDLSSARKILTKRLAAAGFDRSTVDTTADTIVVTLAGKVADDRLDTAKQLVAPGVLGFRRVLATAGQPPADGTTVPAGTGPAPDALRARLGSAYAAGEEYAGQAATGSPPADASGIGVFTSLTPAEVAVLPVALQYFLPTVTCEQLDARPLATVEEPGQPAVACDRGASGPTKYLTDTAQVTGTDVAAASSHNDPAMNGWYVQIHFTGSGQSRWTELTRQLSDDSQSSGSPQQLAVLLDHLVVSAPTVQQTIIGDAVISGNLTRQDTTVLAAEVGFGALPLVATVASVTTSG